MIQTIRGDRRTPIRETTTRIIDRAVKMMLASSMASSLDFFVRYSVKTGTKATVSDPSPRRRRRRFGIRKATKKASEAAPAPKNAATTMSRMNPKMRLSMVAMPTTPAALASLACSAFFTLVGPSIRDVEKFGCPVRWKHMRQDYRQFFFRHSGNEQGLFPGGLAGNDGQTIPGNP